MSEIEEQEEQLRREIAEKQALAEAYRMVREDLAKKQKSSANGSSLPWQFVGVVEQEKPPADVEAKPYGINSRLVRWAISNMKNDYTVRTLRGFLRDNGQPLDTNEIAIVLTRLRRNGEIHQVRQGSGRRPSTFKKPS